MEHREGEKRGLRAPGLPVPCPPLPLGLGSTDEELGAVRVGSGVGHGQDARTRVLQDEILIIKLLPVDGLASSAVMACEVPPLAHKSRNDPVEAGTFVTKSFLPSAQGTEVLCPKEKSKPRPVYIRTRTPEI